MKIYYLLGLCIFVGRCEMWANWGSYRRYGQTGQKTPHSSNNQIILSHPQLQNTYVGILTNSSLKLIQNSYHRIAYSLNQTLSIQIYSKHKNLGLHIHPKTNKTLNQQISIKFHNEEQSANPLNLQNIKKVVLQASNRLCRIDSETTTQILFKCSINKQIVIDIKYDDEEWLQQLMTNSTKAHQDKIDNFMKKHNISDEGPIRQIINQAISSTINSLCLWEDELDDVYVGFCDNSRYQFKMSPYVIMLLQDYDQELGKFVYQNYLTLLENRVYYPTQQQQQFDYQLYPENGEAMLKFIDLKRPLREALLFQAICVKLMVNRISNLHQQLNYRESKKLHPYLIQMLTQPWTSSDKLRGHKSIYDESFTPDYKYHKYGEKLFQSQTKIGWLFKIVDLSSLIKMSYLRGFTNQETMQEYLQQEFGLLNLLSKFLSDDVNAKAGTYLDVIEIEDNARFYPKQVGYGNLLTYIYSGNVFPLSILKRLLSPHGLKSSDETEQDNNYNYRGDIHSYFNLRILQAIEMKLKEDKKLSKNQKTNISELINLTKENLKTKIIKEYTEDNAIYTSWNHEGKGKLQIDWLKILTAVQLK